MSEPVRVGVVGIGAMGLSIARNLHGRGFRLAVRDIDPGAAAAATGLGIDACDSAAALAARSDVLIVVVVDSAQIDDVLFGIGGVAHAGPRSADGERLCVMLCSTIAAEDTERFGARLATLGIDVIDAPISGGPARAGDGTMTMMLAGDASLFDRHDVLLEAMASRRFRIGPRLGDAARTKLVNNLLAGVNLVAAAEAMALGARLGLDRRALLDVIAASSGASWIGGDRMARAIEGDWVPRARAAILTKDVGLAVGMAEAAGIETPLGAEALKVFRATLAAGFADLDDAAVIKAIWPAF